MHRLDWLIPLALCLLLALGGCATTSGGEPEVRIVEVAVPVVKPCPDKRAPAAAYPDSDAAVRAAIAAKDLPGLVKILLAARPLHYQRHAEDDAQIAACVRPPPAPMPP
ncbi:MAG: hypothetical protein Q8L23_15990 [Caulobacter sp.]|nr:hypothetical protein [Caulobacter sp.]